MLSSDKNVETIAQLAEMVKNYIGLQGEYLKLDAVDKLVSLMKAIALLVVFFLIIMAVTLFCSIAIAYWLAGLVGNVGAFFMVAGFYFIVFLIVAAFRKTLIEQPLVRFLTNLFIGKHS